jgi:hypothetical protein
MTNLQVLQPVLTLTLNCFSKSRSLFSSIEQWYMLRGRILSQSCADVKHPSKSLLLCCVYPVYHGVVVKEA